MRSILEQVRRYMASQEKVCPVDSFAEIFINTQQAVVIITDTFDLQLNNS